MIIDITNIRNYSAQIKFYLDQSRINNVFYLNDFFKFNNIDGKTKCFYVCSFDHDKNINGIISFLIIKEYNSLLGDLTARAICMGNPIFSNNDGKIIDSLLSEFNDFVKDRVIYSQFRNFDDTSTYKYIFEKNGFTYEEHLNILLDLTKSEEQLWKEVHSKRRNEIRRAEKHGVEVRLIINDEEFLVAYNVLVEVYSRAKLPLPQLKYFINAKNTLGNKILKIFVAVLDDKILGTMFTLCYNDTIYDWYAGSFQRYYDKYPNDLIPWCVFLWGKKNGYKLFDFGGAGKPNVHYGVRDYKKKFGGEFVNFGRYEKIHKPITYKIVKFAFEVYKRVLK